MEGIGLGTAAIGRPVYINIRHEKPGEVLSVPEFRKRGLAILDDAYRNGVRFFDTSPGYGLAESLLMEWLRGKDDPRIRVATKWGLSYAANFDRHAKVHEIKEHTLERLDAQWACSEKLLPYLTTYQIHSATLETGVLDNRDILQRLHHIKKEHNIRIGLTTTGANQVEVLKKAVDIMVEDEPLFGSFQSTYNIMEQSLLQMKEIFAQTNTQLIIKESLANGRLMPGLPSKEHNGLYRYITTLAEQYNVGADAIGIRFCLDSFPGALVLSGASSSDQLHSNLEAKTFKLHEDELEMLGSYKIEPATYWDRRKQLPWQ